MVHFCISYLSVCSSLIGNSRLCILWNVEQYAHFAFFFFFKRQILSVMICSILLKLQMSDYTLCPIIYMLLNLGLVILSACPKLFAKTGKIKFHDFIITHKITVITRPALFPCVIVFNADCCAAYLLVVIILYILQTCINTSSLHTILI